MKDPLSSVRRRGAAADVEDLLPLAVARDAALAAELRALARDWPRRGKEGAARVVPLGRWADHVCAAMEGGPPAVVALARAPEQRAADAEDGFRDASMALSVLAALRTEEAVLAVLALAADAAGDLQGRRLLAVGCADALNDLLSLGKPFPVSDEVAARARGFLHALLAVPLATAEAAVGCLALRAIGDESSLPVIARVPDLPRPWADVKRSVSGSIRYRLLERANRS